MNSRHLSNEVWDFSAVPQDELFACLVYEYGRESRSFMYSQEMAEAQERLRPYRFDYEAFHKAGRKGEIPRILTTDDEHAAAKETIDYLMNVAGYDHEKFLGAFWDCEEGFTEIFDLVRRSCSPYAVPWLSLPDHLRKRIARSAKDSQVYGPCKLALVRELELVWEQNAQELKRVRENRELQKYGDEEDCALYDATEPARVPPEDGGDNRTPLIAAFSIDFSRYSNAQIVGAFQAWVASARPADCAEPIQRGRKNSDAYAALEWLGVMRALHHCSWRDPRFPKKIKAKGDIACYKARKRAREKFHELFPFLSRLEDPYSWPTAVQRARRKNTGGFTATI